MKSALSKKFVKEVLSALINKNIVVTKIFLHKFVYFLTLQNNARMFKFEPYTYGPFSFSLAKEVESLIFWDEVELNGNNLHLLNIDCHDIDSAHVKKIERYIDDFIEITNNDFSFDNLERIGTVLYCMEALNNQGMDITYDNVTMEFKGWKGNKYSERQIEAAFDKIISHLPILLQ